MNDNGSPAAALQRSPRRCELCQEVAAVHCSSDDASLCWRCDSKVHAANFLVSRHSRSLLCRRCSSPTAWSAAGPRLPSTTFSLCDHCCRRHCVGEEDRRVLSTTIPTEVVEENEGDAEDFEESEDDDDDDDDDEEEGENQVVPWSPTLPTPPVASTSSSDEDDESTNLRLNFKRTREKEDFKFEDDSRSSSSLESETFSGDYRPFKRATLNKDD